jgi:hypothetical protein
MVGASFVSPFGKVAQRRRTSSSTGTRRRSSPPRSVSARPHLPLPDADVEVEHSADRDRLAELPVLGADGPAQRELRGPVPAAVGTRLRKSAGSAYDSVPFTVANVYSFCRWLQSRRLDRSRPPDLSSAGAARCSDRSTRTDRRSAADTSPSSIAASLIRFATVS